MSTTSILTRAAHIVERDGLTRITILGAIGLSAGQGPEGPLSNRAYFTAQAFARHVFGCEIDNETKLRAFLAAWVRDTRRSSESVAAEMRRCADAYAEAAR